MCRKGARGSGCAGSLSLDFTDDRKLFPHCISIHFTLIFPLDVIHIPVNCLFTQVALCD